jgi:hypothetical protein
MSSTVETANEIRPYKVDIPDEELAELRRRIAAVRWPSRELVTDRSQGVQLATMQALTRYWATEHDWRKCEARLNTGVSSARLYWEFKGGFFTAKGVTIPVGVSTFADEIYRVPRSWAEQAYPNLVYYNQHDRGGHFAAWEQPQLLSEDVRATFRSLR